MAGIYIHIPFCRQACRYCDFYFSISLKYRDAFVEAVLKEITTRRGYLQNEQISTIYLGGGTPSVLTEQHISTIMNSIKATYSISESPEITIEANPDDLTKEYLEMLKQSGFNRLSIGVQSFREKDLELMRRSHSARQAIDCMDHAQAKGFDNINMDLIYGLPDLSLNDWENNLLNAMKQPVQHISAYHLTYESGTVFHHWKKQGKLIELTEQLSVEQYELLREITGKSNFEHYEISNFAKEGFRSKHNTIYWKGNKYFGFGPSAHSYNGKDRQWNNSSLKTYIEKIQDGESYYETEKLTIKEKYHDYLLTSLRTAEGADLKFIQQKFGTLIYDRFIEKAHRFILGGEMVREKERLKMTENGWLRSDLIVEKFMLSEDFIIPGQQPLK